MTTAAVETKTETPSREGMLIGRGAYVLKLAAKVDSRPGSEEWKRDFMEKVIAKFKLTSGPWCVKHYKQAKARLAKQAEKAQAEQTAKAGQGKRKSAPKAKRSAKQGKAKELSMAS